MIGCAQLMTGPQYPLGPPAPWAMSQRVLSSQASIRTDVGSSSTQYCAPETFGPDPGIVGMGVDHANVGVGCPGISVGCGGRGAYVGVIVGVGG